MWRPTGQIVGPELFIWTRRLAGHEVGLRPVQQERGFQRGAAENRGGDAEAPALQGGGCEAG